MNEIRTQIQTALSSTFTYDMHSKELEGVMISVISCKTTNDLKHCRVLISIFPDKDKEKKFFAVKNATPFLRKELARKVNLRIVPELTFEIDDSAEYGANIDRLIKSIHNGEKKWVNGLIWLKKAKQLPCSLT